jgi:pimeloyl-ACP methyl ester carboxylesterase
MKQIIFALLAATALMASCKKTEIRNTTMPRTVTSFRQQNLEISNRTGTSASVVLIAGFNSEMATWQKLYNELDPNLTLFTYNRPGVGRSENVPGDRDANTIVEELKSVLDANGVKPPFVLVGHSMGGIYARMFYHKYPSLVKGIVLVDATHEKQLDTLLSTVPQPDRDIIAQLMYQDHLDSLAVIPDGSVKEEFRANYQRNYEQIRSYPSITNLPVYVITSTKLPADNNPLIPTVAAALHQQWAAQAGNKGRFVATTKSGHYIQLDEPRLVADGIKWVMQ